MNRVIADIFGNLLSLFHAIALLALVAFIMGATQENTLTGGEIIMYSSLALISYLLVFGALCTLVSINSYLKEIATREKSLLESSVKVEPKF